MSAVARAPTPRPLQPVIALRGELAEIPPASVLQLLEMNRKTGHLEVHGDDGVGSLWLVDGRPVHAATRTRSGLEAAVEIANTSRGWFVFTSGEAGPEETIDSSVTELLLEASVRLDQSGR